ncbi:MAG: formyl transferase, partial [Gemmatimonadales bacterium]|nr:formyl transferase [Gemmatimonadales bacterium]
VMEWKGDGEWGTPAIALKRPYHLSYPFLFEWEGEHYLIPESVANRRVELYRTSSFPIGWRLDRVLLDDIDAVDPTVVRLDDRWWMFVTVRNPGRSPSTELHVFHAETPLGPWSSHALNPVKLDIRSARPAGRPFEVDGSIYRPSQDCSVRYGGAIVLNRIEQLSETDYREVVVDRIDPGWGPGLIGTHTINSHHELTVVDGLARGARFERWARKKAARRR